MVLMLKRRKKSDREREKERVLKKIDFGEN